MSESKERVTRTETRMDKHTVVEYVRGGRVLSEHHVRHDEARNT